jgi:hypothetical protein
LTEDAMTRKPLPALILALVALPAGALPVLPPDDAMMVAPEPPVHLAAAPDDARASADAWRRWAEDFRREMQDSMGTMFAPRLASAKLVKGAPYSAEVITENNQALADGNVITRKTTGRIYRDGEGRTRQETDAPGGKARSIVIGDPVAREHIVLLPDAKRAVVSKDRSVERNKKVVNVDGTVVRIEDGEVSIDGKAVPGGNVTVKSKAGKEVRIDGGRVFINGNDVTAENGSGSGTKVTVRHESVDGVPREEVRVQVVRIGDNDVIPVPPIPPMPAPPAPPSAPGAPSAHFAPIPPIPPVPPFPPLPGVGTQRFESTAHLGRGVEANLGQKEFDGVRAEGKSTTWTIPAGEIGNRKPINVVSESWYAPELQVTVYSRYSDPRTGEVTYRLAGIHRAEPSPALFKTPQGWQTLDRDADREAQREIARAEHDRAREERDRAREQRDRAREQARKGG